MMTRHITIQVELGESLSNFIILSGSLTHQISVGNHGDVVSNYIMKNLPDLPLTG